MLIAKKKKRIFFSIQREKLTYLNIILQLVLVKRHKNIIRKRSGTFATHKKKFLLPTVRFDPGA